MFHPMRVVAVLVCICLVVCSVSMICVSAYQVTSGSSGQSDYWSPAFAPRSAWVLNNAYPASESGFIGTMIAEYTDNPNAMYRWSNNPDTMQVAFVIMDQTGGTGNSQTFAKAALPTTGECNTVNSCAVDYSIASVEKGTSRILSIDLSSSKLYIKKGQYLAFYSSVIQGLAFHSVSGANYVYYTTTASSPPTLIGNNYNPGYELLLKYTINVILKSTAVAVQTTSLNQSVAANTPFTIQVQLSITGENPPAGTLDVGAIGIIDTYNGTQTRSGSDSATSTSGVASCTVTLPVGGVYELYALFTPFVFGNGMVLASSRSPQSSPAVIYVAPRVTTLAIAAVNQTGSFSVFGSLSAFNLVATVTPTSAVGTITFLYSTGGVVTLADGTTGTDINIVAGSATFTLLSGLPGGETYSFVAHYHPQSTIAYTSSDSAPITVTTSQGVYHRSGGVQIVDPESVSVAAVGGSSSQWVFNLLGASSTAGLVREFHFAYSPSDFAGAIKTGLTLRWQLLESDGGSGYQVVVPRADFAATGEITNFEVISNPMQLDIQLLNIWIEPGQWLAFSHSESSALLILEATGDQFLVADGSVSPVTAGPFVNPPSADHAIGVWFIVGPANAAVSISTADSTPPALSDFTLVAQVAPPSAIGTVSFVDANGQPVMGVNGTSSMSVSFNATGQATFLVAGFSYGGLRQFRAQYSDSTQGALFTSAVSSLLNVTVDPTPTTVVLTHVTPVWVDSAIQLSAEVRPAVSGNVSFTNADGSPIPNGDNIRVVVGGQSGVATFNVSAPSTIQSRSYIATFSPSSSVQYSGSVSSSIEITPQPLATNVVLTGPVGPVEAGASFLLTASVSELLLPSHFLTPVDGAVTMYRSIDGILRLASGNGTGVTGLPLSLAEDVRVDSDGRALWTVAGIIPGGLYNVTAFFNTSEVGAMRYLDSPMISILSIRVAAARPNLILTVSSMQLIAGSHLNFTVLFDLLSLITTESGSVSVTLSNIASPTVDISTVVVPGSVLGSIAANTIVSSMTLSANLPTSHYLLTARFFTSDAVRWTNANSNVIEIVVTGISADSTAGHVNVSSSSSTAGGSGTGLECGSTCSSPTPHSIDTWIVMVTVCALVAVVQRW